MHHGQGNPAHRQVGLSQSAPGRALRGAEACVCPDLAQSWRDVEQELADREDADLIVAQPLCEVQAQASACSNTTSSSPSCAGTLSSTPYSLSCIRLLSSDA